MMNAATAPVVQRAAVPSAASMTSSIVVTASSPWQAAASADMRPRGGLRPLTGVAGLAYG
jgi:hypothetical protein